MARTTDNLTAAVTETLASIAAADAAIREIIASLQAQMPEAHAAELADAAGGRIATVIGERLSQRFDGAVDHDGLHDCLWMTFMSQVAWDDVARYWLNLTTQEGT